MKIAIRVYGKDYECYVVEQPGRAKGTRYKAYGTFDDHFLEAQGPKENLAIKRLKQKAEIYLDY